MAPRSAEQFQAIREESRNRILEAALELFARQGYENTSVRAIVQRAGISQGLLYNYFENKEDLLRAIFQRGMADVRESFRHADEGESPRRKLAHLIRGSMEIIGRNRNFWRLLHGLQTQPAVLERLAGDVESWAVAIRGQLRTYLAEAGWDSPDIEVEILWALIDGVARHYLLQPEEFPLEPVIARIVERYEHPPPRNQNDAQADDTRMRTRNHARGTP